MIEIKLHYPPELPVDRRECLVMTVFSDDPFLGKYNEVQGSWMVAWEKEMPTSTAQIKSWVYVDEIFVD